MNKKYSCDFETTTNEEDCRVWEVGIVDIYTEKFYYGNSIDYLIWFMKNEDMATFYFHNLKFDGEFILHHLFMNGYQHSTEKEPVRKQFTTLISDKGQFFSIKICFENGVKVTILDSLKILPFSVEVIAKSFGLEIGKLEIDYGVEREMEHELTEQEIEYLKNDCMIVAKALKILFTEGLTKMTQASNALADYKHIIGEKVFKKRFPIPKYDSDIRQAYKGGFTYCKEEYRGKDIGEGIVLDVNSLYPSVMYDCMLPYGEGIFFEGKYKEDRIYPLYIQMITCSFEIKENHIPTIQLKHSLAFNPVEYIKSSHGDDVTMCLSSVDLELFLKHYHVYDIQYHSGWKFKATNTLFKEYIDKWLNIKINAELEGNLGMRTLAKLMLNALYGKFALNPRVCNKIPYLDENEIVKYVNGEEQWRDPIYIPVGLFITAYARQKTITSAQKLYNRFIYADTDSLHLIGTELPDCLEIHKTKLGAWKHESTFTRARFIRSKTYIEEIDGEIKITCAGMPSRCYEYVTWENFHAGMLYPGKLQMQHVKGGIILKDIDFTIKK